MQFTTRREYSERLNTFERMILAALDEVNRQLSTQFQAMSSQHILFVVPTLVVLCCFGVCYIISPHSS